MSCKYNNCKHCGYKSECEIYKENAELEKEISVLLSCKNCPENKGGYICQKEYEDKCLAQKIQYIKELQQENTELEEKLEQTEKDLADYQFNYPTIKELQKENAELKRNEFNAKSCLELQQSQDKAILNFMGEQLTKAKEIIKELNEGLDKLYLSGLSNKQIAFIEQLQDKAEAFLNSEVENSSCQGNLDN